MILKVESQSLKARPYLPERPLLLPLLCSSPLPAPYPRSSLDLLLPSPPRPPNQHTIATPSAGISYSTSSPVAGLPPHVGRHRTSTPSCARTSTTVSGSNTRRAPSCPATRTPIIQPSAVASHRLPSCSCSLSLLLPPPPPLPLPGLPRPAPAPAAPPHTSPAIQSTTSTMRAGAAGHSGPGIRWHRIVDDDDEWV
ncbi:hypothetical protein GALMADRAFT_138836 [Galerina marginata CBS 339.88]|uniref:Uncharacterized protein n=1 Tax=Galerina marginata (strain CBS 339.88) TaxID=685588 RepID=A0A067TFL6_GALM3|nr:hypothetical protein GALMADRAFT_138836 [Galerina marginata CBS 339.88]